MNNRKFPFWLASKIDMSKVAKNASEIGRLAVSDWKKEIANSPKVFWYAICFGAGYHFYESWIKPKISPSEEVTGAARRPKPRPGK